MGSQETYTPRRTDPTLEDVLAHVVAGSPEPLKRVYGFANLCPECTKEDGFTHARVIGLIDAHLALYADTAHEARGAGWIYADVAATRAFAARLDVPTWSVTTPLDAKDQVPAISESARAHRSAAGHPVPFKADGTPALLYTDITEQDHLARRLHIASRPLDPAVELTDIRADIRSVQRDYDHPQTVGDPLREVPWITQYDFDALLVRPDGIPVALVERKGVDVRSSKGLDTLADRFATTTGTPLLSLFWTPTVLRARVVGGGRLTSLRTVTGDTDKEAVRVLNDWIIDRVLVNTNPPSVDVPVQFPR